MDGHCRVSLGCPLLSLKTNKKNDLKIIITKVTPNHCGAFRIFRVSILEYIYILLYSILKNKFGSYYVYCFGFFSYDNIL